MFTLSTALTAQVELERFFQDADKFLKTHVEDNNVNYATAKNDVQLMSLINRIGSIDLRHQDAVTQKAFRINAYNLLVIYQITAAYPLESVQDISGFFDEKKHLVAGQLMTLNRLEREAILSDGDPRSHFVLVCGAVDCPPIINTAYRPITLELQLNNQTYKSLNDSIFIRVSTKENKVELSQIFNWYSDDFGKNKSERLAFINSFRESKLNEDVSLGYYGYDWSLNEVKTLESTAGVIKSSSGNNAIRYVVSSTIPKGNTETKIFNNLYTQSFGDEPDGNRSTFFTSQISSLYGVSNTFNAGIELRYRRVLNSGLPSSSTDVFRANDDQFRQGITTIGPKIRWAPVPKWGNFSIQSTLWIPLEKDLEGIYDQGENNKIYADWNSPTFWTQIFNDFSLGSNFSLFTEVDFLWEDLGGNEDDFNRISTPATLILSYFPNPKTTLSALGGFSPYYLDEFDYFYQAGAGLKYQFNRKFELEFLYTHFRNQSLLADNGKASTLNFGIRFNTN
jgi:hypothetical protein